MIEIVLAAIRLADTQVRDGVADTRRSEPPKAHAGPTMSRIKFLIVISIATAGTAAFAREHGRIKRPPPNALEADRMASDMAMNDSLLRKGDIVATDPGVLHFPRAGAGRHNEGFCAGLQSIAIEQKVEPEWLALPDKSVRAQT
jgi:hypothetical protein